jgi:hypothetical protein
MDEKLAALDLPALIGSMADIKVPPPVSYAPQTFAWWVLLGIGLTVLGVYLYVRLQRYRGNAYRRAALSELDRLAVRIRDGKDYGQLAALLRRTALAKFPRREVASLYGPDWLAFLDRTGPSNFLNGPGGAVVTAPYDGGAGLTVDDRARLLAAVRSWIVQHRSGGEDA